MKNKEVWERKPNFMRGMYTVKLYDFGFGAFVGLFYGSCMGLHGFSWVWGRTQSVFDVYTMYTISLQIKLYHNLLQLAGGGDCVPCVQWYTDCVFLNYYKARLRISTQSTQSGLFFTSCARASTPVAT